MKFELPHAPFWKCEGIGAQRFQVEGCRTEVRRYIGKGKFKKKPAATKGVAKHLRRAQQCCAPTKATARNGKMPR